MALERELAPCLHISPPGSWLRLAAAADLDMAWLQQQLEQPCSRRPYVANLPEGYIEAALDWLSAQARQRRYRAVQYEDDPQRVAAWSWYVEDGAYGWGIQVFVWDTWQYVNRRTLFDRVGMWWNFRSREHAEAGLAAIVDGRARFLDETTVMSGYTDG